MSHAYGVALAAQRPNPSAQPHEPSRAGTNASSYRLWQMQNYYCKATQAKGNSADNLMHLLESRVDTLTLRASFANTIYAARQLVNHGHVLVNSFKVSIPSYQMALRWALGARANCFVSDP